MGDTKFHTDEFYALKEQVKALDRLFGEKHKDLQVYLEAELKGIALATEKALSANDKRLEGMNEFRSTLKDQTATFITRVDFERQHDTVKEDIKKLEISRAELSAKASNEDVKVVNDRAGKAQTIAIVSIVLMVIMGMLSLMMNFILKK